MSARSFERAMVLAAEYRSLAARGDMPLAQGARRTIEDLVGSFVHGRLVLPEPVRVAMGLSAP